MFGDEMSEKAMEAIQDAGIRLLMRKRRTVLDQSVLQ